MIGLFLFVSNICSVQILNAGTYRSTLMPKLLGQYHLDNVRETERLSRAVANLRMVLKKYGNKQLYLKMDA